MGLGIPWVARHGTLEGLPRLSVVLLLIVVIAQHIVRLGVVWIARDGLRQRGNGLIILALRKGTHAGFKVCLGFMGCQRHRVQGQDTPEQPQWNRSAHSFLSISKEFGHMTGRLPLQGYRSRCRLSISPHLLYRHSTPPA